MRALLSQDQRYRYALWRVVPTSLDSEHAAEQVLFVMLNPSTADARQDDPTIRRCVGFASTWGYGSLAVANLFALRSPNPAVLGRIEDPVGPENDQWIRQLHGESALTVVAWGSHRFIEDRAERVLRLLDGDVHHLGLTKDGHPRHPLYVAGDTELVPLQRREAAA